MIKNCAFLGLGVMGYPMAGHLASNGYDVVVWNRTGARAEQWAKEYPGVAAKTIEQAVEHAEIVFICVGDDPDVLAVVSSALDSLKACKPGRIIVDHTTASPACARICHAQADALGHFFVDAPVSGGQAGAENGALTIMCGGEHTAFEAVRPVMSSYGKAITYMGESGSGQMTKMVNQICIAGLVQGLSEGIHFAQKAGLDVGAVIEAIGQGAAQSWQMDNRASTMASGEFEFGFAVDWMRKDLRIALETARALGADLPVTRIVDSYYEDIQEMGGARWDTSSLIKRLTK